jgi:hypothetical protein
MRAALSGLLEGQVHIAINGFKFGLGKTKRWPVHDFSRASYFAHVAVNA